MSAFLITAFRSLMIACSGEKKEGNSKLQEQLPEPPAAKAAPQVSPFPARSRARAPGTARAAPAGSGHRAQPEQRRLQRRPTLGPRSSLHRHHTGPAALPALPGPAPARRRPGAPPESAAAPSSPGPTALPSAEGGGESPAGAAEGPEPRPATGAAGSRRGCGNTGGGGRGRAQSPELPSPRLPEPAPAPLGSCPCPMLKAGSALPSPSSGRRDVSAVRTRSR